MESSSQEQLTVGPFQARIAAPYRHPDFLQQLQKIDTLLGSEATPLSHGADPVFRVELRCGGQTLAVAAKKFRRQSLLKDRADSRMGTKAERSYWAARHLQSHGIGTPEPIACLDRWQGRRLVESYYLCIYEPAKSFADHLSHVYWQRPDNDALMALLNALAPAVRAMHDAGFMHRDMGNQNILMPAVHEISVHEAFSAGGGFDGEDNVWASPQFVDLNRGRVFTSLTERQRAFDISRLALPGEYRKFFLHIYCHHQDVPPLLARWENRYRQRFSWHQRTRAWRHPIKTLKSQLTGSSAESEPLYPKLRDLWIWDEKSAQAMIVLSRREKNRIRSKAALLSTAWQSACAAPGIFRRYRRLRKESFQQRLTLSGRVGVALHPHRDYITAELESLAALGNPPVLLRFCHHETPEVWEDTIDLIRQLRARSVSVMVAFVQDRRALLDPNSWRAMLQTVIPRVVQQVDDIEIGHAINRVKWGLWSPADYLTLVAPALELQRQFPSIRLTGPACIDFEYAHVLAALGALPSGTRLAALSHHLYVDRRGYPENPQGAFSTLEKCALLRAIAQWSERTEDRVIISEVNWPVKGTGVWSPVGAGYDAPEGRRNPPGVEERDYADYMLRYYALTLCSGHVERVYWWRLSAHGYGLIDERDNWRRRPAFTALAFFLRTLGDASFVARHSAPEGVYLLEFIRDDARILMAWCTPEAQSYWPRFEYETQWDSLGQRCERTRLTGSPVYLVRPAV